MRYAIALALFACIAYQADAATIKDTQPPDLQNWIEITTSQTPPGAINWWVRPNDKPPLHIIQQPVFWASTPPTIIHVPLEFNIGGEDSVSPFLRMQVNLLPEEFHLSAIAINIGPHNGAGYVVTLTSSVGQRTVVRPAIAIPEPSDVAFVAVGLLANLARRANTPTYPNFNNAVSGPQRAVHSFD